VQTTSSSMYIKVHTFLMLAILHGLFFVFKTAAVSVPTRHTAHLVVAHLTAAEDMLAAIAYATGVHIGIAAERLNTVSIAGLPTELFTADMSSTRIRLADATHPLMFTFALWPSHRNLHACLCICALPAEDTRKHPSVEGLCVECVRSHTCRHQVYMTTHFKVSDGCLRALPKWMVTVEMIAKLNRSKPTLGIIPTGTHL